MSSNVFDEYLIFWEFKNRTFVLATTTVLGVVEHKKYRDLCVSGRPQCNYNSTNQNQEKSQSQESYDPTTSQNQDFSEENRRKELLFSMQE